MDLHQSFVSGKSWDKDELITFWVKSSDVSIIFLLIRILNLEIR